jgi:hypothetical protein
LVVPVAIVGWPLFLVLDGIGTGFAFWVSAGALALANTGVGVALNRLAAAAVHRSFRPAATNGGVEG